VFKLLDKIAADAISSRQLTAEGYLDVRARISRVGIQEYYAFELGDLFSDRDSFSIVKVYRPADEVFRQAAMDSFAKKPVTVGHPWEGVTASNHKDVSVGFSGETMQRDGNFMSGSLRLTVADAVNRVQRGEGELSAGYTCDVTRESGTFEGEAYDAVQRNIMGNHIALVDAGRCGPLCRVGDRAPQMVLDQASKKDCGCKETANMNAVTNPPVALQAMQIDGKTFQVDAVGALLVGILNDRLDASKKTVEKHEGTIAAMTATHDAAIKKLEKDLADAKALAMDANKLDAAVAARTALIADATKILGKDYDFKGKTEAEIRKAAVVKDLGDAATKDKSDAFFESAFDVCVAKAGDGGGGGSQQDNLRGSFQQHQGDSAASRKAIEDARLAAEKKRSEAWKN
jgi:hypothetical protein